MPVWCWPVESKMGKRHTGCVTRRPAGGCEGLGPVNWLGCGPAEAFRRSLPWRRRAAACCQSRRQISPERLRRATRECLLEWLQCKPRWTIAVLAPHEVAGHARRWYYASASSYAAANWTFVTSETENALHFPLHGPQCRASRSHYPVWHHRAVSDALEWCQCRYRGALAGKPPCSPRHSVTEC